MARLTPLSMSVPRLGRKREEPSAGSWLTAQKAGGGMALLDRLGKHAQSVFGGVMPGSGPTDPSYISNPFRLLTFDQLRLIYQRTPEVRASVDQITRRVATWDWMIEPTVDAADSRYEEISELATAVQRFMAAPNLDGETWQEILTKVVTDLLIYDAGVAELVSTRSNGREMLDEIVPLRGADIRPLTDQFGRLLGYEQAPYRSSTGAPGLAAPMNTTQFTPEQILHLRLFPNTEGPEGFPLLESLVNEVVAILRAAEHAMLALDADEIPPGILVLSGLAREAAREATSDLKRMRGQDHKIRVVTTKQNTGIGANWVELRHTPKDLTMSDVVAEIRRTIWRVFGVLPVEMGATEGMPRATAMVQLDVSNSHLLTPILELLEAKINARILPMLLGDDDLIPLLRFRFDRDRDLTPAEEENRSRTLKAYVEEGILTRNEAREAIGYKPFGPEGDVPTVRSGNEVLRLVDMLRRSEIATEEPEDELPEDGPPMLPEDPSDTDSGGSGSGSGSGGVEDPEAGAGDDSDNAPGEANEDDRAAFQRSPACRMDGESAGRRGMHRRNRLHEDLPSDWQSPGRFDDVRTLDLRALWEEVAGYSRDVEPLYDEAEAEVLAIVEAEYRQSGLGDAELTRLRNRTSEALDRLASRWSLETRPRYRQIAKVGRDAAADFTATPVVDDWQERADQYHGRAMQYLVRSDGLIGALRTKLFTLFARVSDLRSRGSEMEHRVQHEGVEPDLEQEAPTEEVLAATALIFATQKHRIANWSGKSVELANQTMAAGMEEGSGGSVEWFVEWVSVGDGASCIDCADLGSRGFIRMADLPTYPGGDTRCRARCRCVLVSWTAAEIQNGTATFLGGGNTGTPL